MFFKKDSSNNYSAQSLTPTDLVRYIESLIIHSRNRERITSSTNYGWLAYKPSLHSDATINSVLNPLQPMLNKMAPESCASICIKIDNYVTEKTTVDDIINTLKKLIEEQLNLQAIEQNVSVIKRRQRKNIKI